MNKEQETAHDKNFIQTSDTPTINITTAATETVSTQTAAMSAIVRRGRGCGRGHGRGHGCCHGCHIHNLTHPLIIS